MIVVRFLTLRGTLNTFSKVSSVLHNTRICVQLLTAEVMLKLQHLSCGWDVVSNLFADVHFPSKPTTSVVAQTLLTRETGYFKKNLSNFAPWCPVMGKFILLVVLWEQSKTSFLNTWCLHNQYALITFLFFFFSSRVKLKHFEKFQDTAEALAGKVED